MSNNNIWNDFITIDGENYNIKVYANVKRNADFLDRYAKRLSDGDLSRKLIGVYFNYKSIKFEKQTDENYSEYKRLFNKLTECKEFHDIKIGNFSFKAYFSGVSDSMYKFKDGKEYYKDLTVDFTAKKPYLT